MKKILFIGFLFCSLVSFAQVPSGVRVTFQRDYPGVNWDQVRWEQRNNQWHGYYRDGYNRDVDTYYDEYGRRIDTHVYYDRQYVPPRIDRRIRRRYPEENYRVYRIERPAARPLFQIQIGKRNPYYTNERGRRRRYEDRH
jgi:hypothetical protein